MDIEDGDEDRNIQLERHSLVLVHVRSSPAQATSASQMGFIETRSSGEKLKPRDLQPPPLPRKNSVYIELEHLSKELNLDYLEEGRLCSPCSPTSLPQLSPDTPDQVKLVLLGAPGVGKTSIIQQFVWNNFPQDYSPTDCRHTYYPTVIVNGRVYEVKITDLPAVPYFPVSSVYELRDCPLRDATAYMMVLDLSDLETFRYLETVREQILESRDSLPALVVGNKIDLLDTRDDASLARRRDVMDRVKTLWRCEYAECSARYSSLVCHVFRQLMVSVESQETTASSHACPSVFAHLDALGGSKCSIL